MVTFVYGPNISSDRSTFWAELSFMAGKWYCPWVAGGDFIIIRFSSEKRGCGPLSSAMRDFLGWIRRHELIDLPMGGARCTWYNNQHNPAWTDWTEFWF